MIRKLFASDWTAAAVGALILLVHAFWFARSQYHADVISGFGVAIADLGVFVTAQPFIRQGITRTAHQQFDVDAETKPEDLSAPVDVAATCTQRAGGRRCPDRGWDLVRQSARSSAGVTMRCALEAAGAISRGKRRAARG